MTFLWHDQQVAARVRAHMPDESTVDLDAHARLIGKTVAEAELARVARSLVPGELRELEVDNMMAGPVGEAQRWCDEQTGEAGTTQPRFSS